LPEASARLRPDSTLAGRSRPATGRKSAAVVASALRRLSATPARGYAAAALTAALVGIVVNALALQHARHPAPFFARAPIAGAPSPPPTAAQTAAVLAVPTPPARPAQPAAGTAGGGDAIAQVLRAEDEQETQKRLAVAQAALVKLGYVVKADGEESAATSLALRDFERAHGLPLSNDVSPRLLKALTAVASAAGR
jgi:hypothetical protein